MFELRIVRERRQSYGPLPVFRCSADVWAVFRAHFDAADREQCLLLLLNQKNRPIRFHVVSIGSLTASLLHPREVIKAIVLANAAAVILMHGHPSSGDPTPSSDDLQTSRRLKALMELLGVKFLDSIVFGDGQFISLADDGYLQEGR